MAVTQSGRNDILSLAHADIRSLEKSTPDGRIYYQAGNIENKAIATVDDVGPSYNKAASDAPVLVTDVSSLARSPLYRSIGTLNSKCTGTLVAPRVVLTTGSCVYSNGQWLWSGMKFIPGLLPDGTQPYSYALAAGTLLAGSKLPLRTWMLALHLLTATKTNLSALELMRHLGVNYKAAWRLKHKVMQAMTEREDRG